MLARLRTPFGATRADAEAWVLERYLRAVRTVAVSKYEQVEVLLELLRVENFRSVEVVGLRRYAEELLHLGVVVEQVEVVVLDFAVLFLLGSGLNHVEPLFLER